MAMIVQFVRHYALKLHYKWGKNTTKIKMFDVLPKAKLLLLKLLQLFARDVLAMKKLEIEKTKPTFIISVLKVDIIKMGLVFLISSFFITKTPPANNWRRKKIPFCSYSALHYI